MTFDLKKFTSLLFRLCMAHGQTMNEELRTWEIAAFLDSVNVQHRTDSAGNLMVFFGEGEWQDTVVFDAHVDVVGKGFSEPTIGDDGKIYGLGTGDNLTAVTLLCLLAEEIASGGIKLSRPLCLLFSVCEEGYGNLKGVRRFVDDREIPPYLFVSFDLSYREYSISGLGSRRFRVNASGPGGHSWDDRHVSSAIERMIHFLMMLRARIKGLDELHSAPFSFNIGIIGGGEGVNIIACRAEVHFEFRSTSEPLLEEAAEIVAEEVKRSNESGGDVRFEMFIEGERPAAKPVMPETGENPLKQVWKELGIPVRCTVRSTNINYPLSKGWSCICTGLCECAGYHTENEYIVTDSVPRGWKLLESLLKTLQ
jgi:acetylornithine deacetylase/succinyl-diaminopimelate desuccinylase-like protein